MLLSEQKSKSIRASHRIHSKINSIQPASGQWMSCEAPGDHKHFGPECVEKREEMPGVKHMPMRKRRASRLCQTNGSDGPGCIQDEDARKHLTKPNAGSDVV